jgi:hypothetical protein
MHNQELQRRRTGRSQQKSVKLPRTSQIAKGRDLGTTVTLECGEQLPANGSVSVISAGPTASPAAGINAEHQWPPNTAGETVGVTLLPST